VARQGGSGFDEHGDEWRLGMDLSAEHDHEPVARATELLRNLSHERLTHPLHVVTVEHLSWAIVAMYTIATRLVALGARPLSGEEARHALYAFDLAEGVTSAGNRAAYAGWLHLVTAGFFGVAGASDFTARIGFALAGMLLIAMAFELRHYVGRAGGLALGAMLAISPGVTWFSRASATATAAAALELTAIAIFMALIARPSKPRAAALGIAGGLMIAADPSGLVAAVIFLAALAIVGLYDLVTRANAYLGIRVWIDRYAPLLVTVIVAAALIWGASQMLVPDGFNPTRQSALLPTLPRRAPPSVLGIRTYPPVIALEDFLIVIATAIGVAAILAMRVRTRFAAWCLVWMALSGAYYLWTPAVKGTNIEILVQILLPMAVVGAIGIDWLHHTDAWRLVWMPLAALALMTLFFGMVANFIRATPDASEAAWDRHGNLYWGADATTVQARIYARRAAAGLTPAAATVYFDGDIAPAIRWYLRDLRPVATQQAASVIVSSRVAMPDGESRHEDSNDVNIYRFGATERWSPDYTTLDAWRALRFVLTGGVWSDVTFDEVTIAARPAGVSAPTANLTPRE
jgi:hypothetical protein